MSVLGHDGGSVDRGQSPRSGLYRGGRTGTFLLNVALNNILCMIAVVLGTYLHDIGRQPN